MPAPKSIAAQEIVEYSGFSPSRPSGMRPKRENAIARRNSTMPIASEVNSQPRLVVIQPSPADDAASTPLGGDRAPRDEGGDDEADADQDRPVDAVADLLVLDRDPRHERRVDAVGVLHLLQYPAGLACCRLRRILRRARRAGFRGLAHRGSSPAGDLPDLTGPRSRHRSLRAGMLLAGGEGAMRRSDEIWFEQFCRFPSRLGVLGVSLLLASARGSRNGVRHGGVDWDL